MTDDQSTEIPGTIRGALDLSLRRVRELRDRLAVNERRILALEGRSGGTPSWTHTVGTADAVIAAVAAVEIATAQDAHSGFINEHAGAALARTGLTSDDLERLAHADPASRMGAVNLLQGHIGEQVALDLINSGRIPVPDGRVARLAASPNQPAHDIDLVDPDGHGATLHAQVKISDSASTIREHLMRYPDVDVVYANHDAAGQFVGDHGVSVIRSGTPFPSGHGKVIVDMGVSQAEIRAGATDILHGGAHETLAHKVLTDLPVISLLLIAGRAATSYLETDTPETEILRTAGRRARDVLIANGLGHAATAATSEPLFGSLTAVGYLVVGNAVRAARGDINRATDRFTSTRNALSTFSPTLPCTWCNQPNGP
ncbi:MAG: hypothetical protein EBZ52_03890 [Actinobacteria bacterium]|nr:hypothetical protein [Actinomycetota bacterium]